MRSIANRDIFIGGGALALGTFIGALTVHVSYGYDIALEREQYKTPVTEYVYQVPEVCSQALDLGDRLYAREQEERTISRMILDDPTNVDLMQDLKAVQGKIERIGAEYADASTSCHATDERNNQ